MTTIVIDEKSREGKAFIDLLRQMKFARVLESTNDWWGSISPAERKAIGEGLANIDDKKTVSHDQMKKGYKQFL